MDKINSSLITETLEDCRNVLEKMMTLNQVRKSFKEALTKHKQTAKLIFGQDTYSSIARIGAIFVELKNLYLQQHDMDADTLVGCIINAEMNDRPGSTPGILLMDEEIYRNFYSTLEESATTEELKERFERECFTPELVLELAADNKYFVMVLDGNEAFNYVIKRRNLQSLKELNDTRELLSELSKGQSDIVEELKAYTKSKFSG